MTRAVGWICAEGHLGVVVHSVAVRIRRAIGVGPAQSKALHVVCQSDRGVGGDREGLGGAPSIVRIGHRRRDRVAARVGRWCRRRAIACAADAAVAVVKSGGDARGGGGECFLNPAVNKVGRGGEGDVAGVERHWIGRDAYRAGNWIVVHRIGGREGDRVIRGAGTWSRVRGVECKNARHAGRATAQVGGSEGLVEGNRRGSGVGGDRRRRFGNGEV